jgi:hypothetical protein
MGTWNYRVFKNTSETDHVYYAVHEVYYSDDGTMNGRTESAVWPTGQTVEELRSDIMRMLKALEQPVMETTD